MTYWQQFLICTESLSPFENIKFLLGRHYNNSDSAENYEKNEIWRLNKTIHKLNEEIRDLRKKVSSEIQKNNNSVFEYAQKNIFDPLEQRFETIIKVVFSWANLLLCAKAIWEELMNLRCQDNSVSSFNDIVYKTAKKYNADVLELRHIFTSPEDYANLLNPHILERKIS